MGIQLAVKQGDAFEFGADVLVAKHAQSSYGLDLAIKRNAFGPGAGAEADLPEPGAHRFIEKVKGLRAGIVLMVGVEPLRTLGYAQIRAFARRSMEVLARERPDTRHVALTLHGVGYGLDETEAFESEIAGLIDALNAGSVPLGLREITIIESDIGRAGRLTAALGRLVPDGVLGNEEGVASAGLSPSARHTLGAVGYDSDAKPHVFVAMPFSPEFEDIYYYGIQGAVNAAGYLCERADLCAFTGDVMDWVRSRISSATLIVADLTGANANVYLEVGFAWALKIPAVLIVSRADELKFDVKGQRVIVYNSSIKTLQALLTAELIALRALPA